MAKVVGEISGCVFIGLYEECVEFVKGIHLGASDWETFQIIRY